MKRRSDYADIKQAIANSAGIAGGGALVGTKIDATGFSNARFIFSFGANAGTTAALSSNIGVWKASTSGATFSSIASALLAAVTSGVLSNNVMVIDTVVPTASPWLQISGNIASTAITHSCLVELYNGVNNPPTASPQQIVTV